MRNATHRIIADQWESYCRFVYGVAPAEMPPEQMQEVRRAFYGGANGLFTAIIKILDPGEEATEADLVKMDAIDTELDAFAQAVAEGNA